MLSKPRKDNGIWGLRLNGNTYIHAGRFFKSSQAMLFDSFHISIIAKFHSYSGDILSGGLAVDALRLTLDGGHMSVTSGTNPRTIPLLYSGVAGEIKPALGQVCLITFHYYDLNGGNGRWYYHINGLLTGESIVSGIGDRTTPASAGPLLIGRGCDMTIYQVRLVAESTPIVHGNVGSPWHPERQGMTFENYVSLISPDYGRPNLFYDFTAGEVGGGLTIPDYGEGYGGGGAGTTFVRHPGRICHVSQGTAGNGFSRLPIAEAPVWEYETDHPFYFDRRLPTKTYRNYTPPSAPVGALVYDSFSREDVTLMTHSALHQKMGSTESGSLGPLPWQVIETTTVGGGRYGQLGYAIMGGSLYVPSYNYGTIAMVDALTPNIDMTLEAGWTDVGAGVVFRIADETNHIIATRYFDNVNWRFETGTIIAGVYSVLQSTIRAPATNFVRVVANGTSISLYDDTTLVHTVTSSAFLTNTKHGIRTFVSDQANKLIWYSKSVSFLIKAA